VCRWLDKRTSISTKTAHGVCLLLMSMYRLLADAVVAIHLALVGFIVIGMAAIVLGIALRRHWARNFYFRAIHLVMIAIVVEKAILGASCPLTDWEDQLREKAGETVAQGTFIGRLLHNILFWHVPQSTLNVVYCVFGLAVLLTFVLAPPRWPWRRRGPK
jgi:hypothetical protein